VYKLFARMPTCRLNWKWFTVAAILSRSRCAWDDHYWPEPESDLALPPGWGR
jgi:hypothetical protein